MSSYYDPYSRGKNAGQMYKYYSDLSFGSEIYYQPISKRPRKGNVTSSRRIYNREYDYSDPDDGQDVIYRNRRNNASYLDPEVYDTSTATGSEMYRGSTEMSTTYTVGSESEGIYRRKTKANGGKLQKHPENIRNKQNRYNINNTRKRIPPQESNDYVRGNHKNFKEMSSSYVVESQPEEIYKRKNKVNNKRVGKHHNDLPTTQNRHRNINTRKRIPLEDLGNYVGDYKNSIEMSTSYAVGSKSEDIYNRKIRVNNKTAGKYENIPTIQNRYRNIDTRKRIPPEELDDYVKGDYKKDYNVYISEPHNFRDENRPILIRPVYSDLQEILKKERQDKEFPLILNNRQPEYPIYRADFGKDVNGKGFGQMSLGVTSGSLKELIVGNQNTTVSLITPQNQTTNSTPPPLGLSYLPVIILDNRTSQGMGNSDVIKTGERSNNISQNQENVYTRSNNKIMTNHNENQINGLRKLSILTNSTTVNELRHERLQPPKMSKHSPTKQNSSEKLNKIINESSIQTVIPSVNREYVENKSKNINQASTNLENIQSEYVAIVYPDSLLKNSTNIAKDEETEINFSATAHNKSIEIKGADNQNISSGDMGSKTPINSQNIMMKKSDLDNEKINKIIINITGNFSLNENNDSNLKNTQDTVDKRSHTYARNTNIGETSKSGEKMSKEKVDENKQNVFKGSSLQSSLCEKTTNSGKLSDKSNFQIINQYQSEKIAKDIWAANEVILKISNEKLDKNHGNLLSGNILQSSIHKKTTKTGKSEVTNNTHIINRLQSEKIGTNLRSTHTDTSQISNENVNNNNHNLLSGSSQQSSLSEKTTNSEKLQDENSTRTINRFQSEKRVKDLRAANTDRLQIPNKKVNTNKQQVFSGSSLQSSLSEKTTNNEDLWNINKTQIINRFLLNDMGRGLRIAEMNKNLEKNQDEVDYNEEKKSQQESKITKEFNTLAFRAKSTEACEKIQKDFSKVAGYNDTEYIEKVINYDNALLKSTPSYMATDIESYHIRVFPSNRSVSRISKSSLHKKKLGNKQEKDKNGQQLFSRISGLDKNIESNKKISNNTLRVRKSSKSVYKIPLKKENIDEGNKATIFINISEDVDDKRSLASKTQNLQQNNRFSNGDMQYFSKEEVLTDKNQNKSSMIIKSKTTLSKKENFNTVKKDHTIKTISGDMGINKEQGVTTTFKPEHEKIGKSTLCSEIIPTEKTTNSIRVSVLNTNMEFRSGIWETGIWERVLVPLFYGFQMSRFLIGLSLHDGLLDFSECLLEEKPMV